MRLHGTWIRGGAAMLVLGCWALGRQAPAAAAGGAELVTGPPLTLTAPSDRAAALAMLAQVRQNFAFLRPGVPAYDLKVSFNAGGAAAYVGAGSMEEAWLDNRDWTWSAQVGDARIDREGGSQISSSNPAGPVPLRVAMARAALFWPTDHAPAKPDATIRSFAATGRGAALTCLLFSGANFLPVPTGRDPQEWEFCVDANSGLLRVWSPVPGVYANYDYDRGPVFFGFRLPSRVVIAQGGHPALDLQVDSITSLVGQLPTPPGLLQPSGGMSGPLTYWHSLPLPAGSNAPAQSIAILHVSVSPQGKITESEAVDNTHPELVAALQAALPSLLPMAVPGRSSGQREAYIGATFVPAAAAASAPPLTLTPLAGAGLNPGHEPYLGTQLTDVAQTLADGNLIERTTLVRMARDAQGNTYRETLQTNGAAPREREYQLTLVTPRQGWQVFPQRNFATLDSASGNPALRLPPLVDGAEPLPPPNQYQPPQQAQLGTQTFQGLSAHGVRTTQVIPAGADGNRDAITVVREIWTADDIGEVVKSVVTDPRWGVTTIIWQDLREGNPPPELFTIPSNYTATDRTGKTVPLPAAPAVGNP